MSSQRPQLWLGWGPLVSSRWALGPFSSQAITPKGRFDLSGAVRTVSYLDSLLEVVSLVELKGYLEL